MPKRVANVPTLLCAVVCVTGALWGWCGPTSEPDQAGLSIGKAGSG